MSLFRTAQEHGANPPDTWNVTKHADRSWHLTSKDGVTLDRFTRKRDAEAGRTEGWVAALYEKERRWYAGETIPGWKPYVRPAGDPPNAADYATAMAALGCDVKEYGRARSGGGMYCATHSEYAVYDGPAREVCHKAYDTVQAARTTVTA